VSPLDLLRRRRGAVSTTLAPADDPDSTAALLARLAKLEAENAAAQDRKAELEAQYAALQAQQAGDVDHEVAGSAPDEEPDLDVQLARVGSAIETAAREAADAALRGDNALATAASERQARLLPQRDTLREHKAAQDRAAQAVRLRDQVAVLHAQLAADLSAVRDEYVAAQQRLPSLIRDLERNLDVVGLAPEKLNTLLTAYSSQAESLRRGAATNGIDLGVPVAPTCSLPLLHLDWASLERISQRAVVLLIVVADRFPMWAMQMGISFQKKPRSS
jgi:hypothetical protein